MSRKKLEAAIRRLVGCPALNLDDLEEEDRAAIHEARALLDRPDVTAAAATPCSEAPPGDPAQPKFVARCPVCGERDASKFQISLPAWFRAEVARTDDGIPYFNPGELVETDAEADARLYCESCGEVRDEPEFVGDAEGGQS